MIDFHNHVLPSVDDGSSSLEMSLDMLKKASEDNTNTIVNTVHFNHPKMQFINTDADNIRNQCLLLEKEARKNNIKINIIPHAEVYYDDKILEAKNNPITLLNNKYMLIEFSPLIEPIFYKENFYKLQLEGIIPIIAHVERYRSVQKNANIVKEWIDLGYIIQINCASLIGDFGKEIKSISEYLFRNGLVHILGSDAHNNKNRNFCLQNALSIVERNFGEMQKNQIIQNLENLLSNEELKTINLSKRKSIFDAIF